MAFSNLVLPAVAPVQAGGQSLAAMQNVNAFTRGNLDNQILNAQSQYAPQQAQANAFLTQQQANFLPYQYKMQALPMMLMGAQGDPALQKQIISQITSPFQGGSSNQLMPLNSPPQNSLLSTLMNKLTGNQPSNNAVNQVPASQAYQQNTMGNIPVLNGNQPNPNQNNGFNANTMPSPQNGAATNANGSPIVPATNGDVAGISGKITAGFNMSPYGVKAIPDPSNPGKVIYIPTETNVSDSEKAINAAQRVAPQLEALSKAAQPFMTAQGYGNLAKESIENFFLGGKNSSPSQYAEEQSLIAAAPEALVKAYGLRPTNETIERMENVIIPHLGENPELYQQRIMGKLQQIKNEQVGITQNNLQSGYSTAPENNSNSTSTLPPDNNTAQALRSQPQAVNDGLAQTSVKQSIQNTADQFKSQIIQFQGPDGKIWNVPQGKAQKFLDNNFKRVG